MFCDTLEVGLLPVNHVFIESTYPSGSGRRRRTRLFVGENSGETPDCDFIRSSGIWASTLLELVRSTGPMPDKSGRHGDIFRLVRFDVRHDRRLGSSGDSDVRGQVRRTHDSRHDFRQSLGDMPNIRRNAAAKFDEDR